MLKEKLVYAVWPHLKAPRLCQKMKNLKSRVYLESILAGYIIAFTSSEKREIYDK